MFYYKRHYTQRFNYYDKLNNSYKQQLKIARNNINTYYSFGGGSNVNNDERTLHGTGGIIVSIKIYDKG